MFAVVVTFQIKPGKMSAFLPLMLENARISQSEEVGCRQFDVCKDLAEPDEVLLYELYDTQAAFEAHLASAHFKQFDAAVSAMIAGKQVKSYNEVVS